MKRKYKSFLTQSTEAVEYAVRTEMHEQKEYLVVPVVMMVEGVHSGSRGPVLHTASELGKIPESWNGIPVTVNHPQDDNGKYISANSPNVLRKYAIGIIFNTHMDGDQLKAEAWIEVDKLRAFSDVEIYLNEQRALDVSVGVFSEDDPTEGVWNGEEYQSIARNHRPDHLALLPGGTGACSWGDGCGIRNNEKTDMKKQEQIEHITALKLVYVYEQSLEAILESAWRAINAMDTETESYYVREVFKEYLVYEKRTKNTDTSKTFKHSYAVENNKVILAGDAVEVVREVSYVPIGTNSKTNDKKEDIMTEKKKPCCPNKVEELIANELSNFTKEDREWLLAQDEATIEKLMPKTVESPQVNSEAEITKDQAVEVLIKTISTVEDFVNILPEGIKVHVEAGLALHTEKKKQLVDGIMDNAGEGVWTEEELTAMEMDMLEKLAKTSGSKTDYSGLSAGKKASEPSEEVLMPTGS